MEFRKVGYNHPKLLEKSILKVISSSLFGLGIFFSIVLSGALFLYSSSIIQEQVGSYIKSFSPSILSHLIESDYYSIENKVKLLENTKLFRLVSVVDVSGYVIGEFGDDSGDENINLIKIRDEAGVEWGLFRYKVNYFVYFPPFVFVSLITMIITVFFTVSIRKFLNKRFQKQFNGLSYFIESIESISIAIDEKTNKLAIRNRFGNGLTYFSEEAEINKVVNQLVARVNSYQEEIANLELEKSKHKLIVGISAQVAHDIRSPLAALSVATQDLKEVPEDRRILIRSALQRIEDITNDLNKKKNENAKDSSAVVNDKQITEMIAAVIETLISEKRMQFRSASNISIRADFEDGTHGLFAKLQPKEFKRALSNLINNAIEAFEDGGEVVVNVSLHNDQIHIAVKDNGKGIPQDILNKLGERGATFGKEHLEKSGSGLGLHHTKESLKKWGGDLRIESTVGEGTRVTMILPKAPAPAWFAESIRITPNTKIVVFDDDVSIHQVWQARFDEKKIPRERVFHFSTPEDLIAWHTKEKPSGEILYLSDQEFLGCDKTGTQTIRELGIGSQSILVTSRFEEDDVRKACAEMKVKLLPKNLAGYVPIVGVRSEGLGGSLCDQSALGGLEKQTSSEEKFESDGSGLLRHSTPRNDTNKTLVPDPLSLNPSLILIDDDLLMHATWKAKAIISNKKIVTFADPQEFLAQKSEFSKDTPIYIDSNLKNGVKGEEISKWIYEQGFKEIYLATGDDASDFAKMPHIKKVVGKQPPF